MPAKSYLDASMVTKRMSPSPQDTHMQREACIYRSDRAEVPLEMSREASSFVLGEKGFSREPSKQRGQSVGLEW